MVCPREAEESPDQWIPCFKGMDTDMANMWAGGCCRNAGENRIPKAENNHKKKVKKPQLLPDSLFVTHLSHAVHLPVIQSKRRRKH